MKRLLLITLTALMALTAIPAHASHDILGETMILPEDMCDFVRLHNPDFALEIAEAYYDIAERYGIRGDVALCQAILETGWFKFMDGTQVLPEQFNFCGLGVTGPGERGNIFTTMIEGVTAQMQHLFAYATDGALPEGEYLVDVRFALVTRGCAPTWEALSGRWAMNKHYGKSIMRLYDQMKRHSRKIAENYF